MLSLSNSLTGSEPGVTSSPTAFAGKASHNDPSDVSGEPTVLIVDDDSAIRAAAAMLLQCQGYKSISASNGLEALMELDRSPQISAVLLDVVMPVMNGEDTFRQIRTFWPDLPVIMISGFAQNEIAQRLGNLTPNGFVQKPFTLAKLTGVLAGVLN